MVGGLAGFHNLKNIKKEDKEREDKKMKYQNRQEFEKADAFGVGAPNDAYAQYFAGNSFLNALTDPKECPVFLANVTFEPGCRNNWHIHHADKGGGQILVCTAGQGVYQEWGKGAQILNPGENCSNEWCEPVTDEQYQSALEG